MIRLYAKVFLRAIRKKILISITLITILSIALCASYVSFSILFYELNYDTFNKSASKVYRVTRQETKEGVTLNNSALTPPVLYSVFKEEVPEVESVARLFSRQGVVRAGTKKFNEYNIYNVDNELITILSINIIDGDKLHPLSNPHSVIISETYARKYFGTVDVVGQHLKLNDEDYVLSAVFEDLPTNSHLALDIAFSYSTFTHVDRFTNGWQWNKVITYLKISDDGNGDAIQRKLFDIAAKNQQALSKNDQSNVNFALQSLLDIHTSSKDISDESQKNKIDIRSLQFLGLTGVILLIVSFLNYSNIIILFSFDRKKEFEIRKSFGARRVDLIKQILTDAAIISFVAIILSIVVLVFSMDYITYYFDLNISDDFIRQPRLLISFLAAYLVGFMAVVLLTIYNSVRNIRPSTSSIKSINPPLKLRKGILVVQLMLAFFVCNMAIVLVQQYELLKTSKTLFDSKSILVVDAPNLTDSLYFEKMNGFKNAVIDYSKFSSFTISSSVPGEEIPDFFENSVSAKGTLDFVNDKIYKIYTDEQYLPLFGIKFIAGRNFDSKHGSDGQNVIINEKALSLLGFNSPEEALNKSIYCKQGTYSIIGVCQDYRHQSMKTGAEPIILLWNEDLWGYFSFKGSFDEASINFLKKNWHNFVPESPFDYSYMNDLWEKNYSSEKIISRSFSFFSILTISIILLGAFSLISLTLKSRQKPIALRWILGADFSNLIVNTSKEFLLLIMIGFLISLPFSIYFSGLWLESYSTRVSIPMPYFFIPLVLTGLFSLGAVLIILKRSLRNALSVIKHE